MNAAQTSLSKRSVLGVTEMVFDFGTRATASTGIYVPLGVSGITIVALLLVCMSKRSPEAHYQGLFEAEQRSIKPQEESA